MSILPCVINQADMGETIGRDTKKRTNINPKKSKLILALDN